jgi:hypothetical protein
MACVNLDRTRKVDEQATVNGTISPFEAFAAVLQYYALWRYGLNSQRLLLFFLSFINRPMSLHNAEQCLQNSSEIRS